MLRTVRIASFVCIGAAAVGVAGFSVFGFKANAEIQDILAKQSLVEKMKSEPKNGAQKEEAVSPLVVQAKAFALRIDPPPPPPPPPPPKPVEKPKTQVTTVEPENMGTPPPPKTVKFDLVATVKYQQNPEKSLALFNLVSEGFKWFRQGEKVGNFTVEEVKEGSVVLYQNGVKDTELFVPPQTPIKSLLKSDQIASAAVKGPSSTSTVAAGQQPGGVGTKAEVDIVQPVTGVNPAIAQTAVSGEVVQNPTGAIRINRGSLPQPVTAPIQPIRQPKAVQPEPAPEPEPTPEQRKQSIDESISSIKQIMNETREGMTDAERVEENKAWEDLLKVLEQEKQVIETPDSSAPAQNTRNKSQGRGEKQDTRVRQGVDSK